MFLSHFPIEFPVLCTPAISFPFSCIKSNNHPEHASLFLLLAGIFRNFSFTITPSHLWTILFSSSVLLTSCSTLASHPISSLLLSFTRNLKEALHMIYLTGTALTGAFRSLSLEEENQKAKMTCTCTFWIPEVVFWTYSTEHIFAQLSSMQIWAFFQW